MRATGRPAAYQVRANPRMPARHRPRMCRSRRGLPDPGRRSRSLNRAGEPQARGRAQRFAASTTGALGVWTHTYVACRPTTIHYLSGTPLDSLGRPRLLAQRNYSSGPGAIEATSDGHDYLFAEQTGASLVTQVVGHRRSSSRRLRRVRSRAWRGLERDGAPGIVLGGMDPVFRRGGRRAVDDPAFRCARS